MALEKDGSGDDRPLGRFVRGGLSIFASKVLKIMRIQRFESGPREWMSTVRSCGTCARPSVQLFAKIDVEAAVFVVDMLVSRP